MGFDRIILLSWLVLFTSTIVSAQENAFGFDFNNLPHNTHFNFPVLPANVSFIRDNILPFFNGFTSLPNFINPLRVKRSIEYNHRGEYHNYINQLNANDNYQTRTTTESDANDRKINLNNDRLSIIIGVTSCNYAEQPGSTCLSCHEAITCFENNRAVVRRCFLGLGYCNNGHCSFMPGNKCCSTPTPNSSTSSFTTSATSTSTSITTSTSSSASTITPRPANTTPTTISTSSNTTPISPVLPLQ